MQSGKIITLSVWLMISFNLLLAFGSVWSFQRMSPEIRRIFERNVISLDACENMLFALAEEKVNTAEFRKALSIAEHNITERGEKESLIRIRALLPDFEGGSKEARSQIIHEISKLSEFNKSAIVDAAEKTQKMRRAGAWGVVFMTLFFFMAAIFFEQRLRRSLLKPLQEIASVLEARRQGDQFRRCNDIYASKDMKNLFKSINDLLDNGSKEK